MCTLSKWGVDFVEEQILTKNACLTNKLKELRTSSMVSLEDLFQTMAETEQAKAAKEAPNSSLPIGHCKVIFVDNDVQSAEICSNDTNELHGLYFNTNCDVQSAEKQNEGSSRVFPYQLPPKKLNP
ncbi:hypothetical protein Tco_0980445 [Tanacetum coccineum]